MEIGVHGVLGPPATKTVGQMGFKAVQGVVTIIHTTMVVIPAVQVTRAAQPPSPATESAVMSLHNGIAGELGVHVAAACSPVGLETRQDKGPVGEDPVLLPVVEAIPYRQKV